MPSDYEVVVEPPEHRRSFDTGHVRVTEIRGLTGVRPVPSPSLKIREYREPMYEAHEVRQEAGIYQEGAIVGGEQWPFTAMPSMRTVRETPEQ